MKSITRMCNHGRIWPRCVVYSIQRRRGIGRSRGLIRRYEKIERQSHFLKLDINDSTQLQQMVL